MTASPPAADAPARAVEAIATARHPLLTGLVAANAAVAVAACDLAEAAGAAIDPGSPETARVSGPILARIGGVTAAPEELRDRADLAILWFCDPERSAPGFVERFVTRPVNGRPRHTIAVGWADGHMNGTHHRHCGIAATAAVDLSGLTVGKHFFALPQPVSDLGFEHRFAVFRAEPLAVHDAHAAHALNQALAQKCHQRDARFRGGVPV